MNLHTVFITHNRLELTKEAVSSYLDTVTVPFTYLIVDNASIDGTQTWAAANGHPLLFLPENKYPGYACNRGWEQALPIAELLHRADNDFRFLPGWCNEVERCFADLGLGQLGMRTVEQEGPVGQNVGGNNIIRRQLWDDGLRYDERPWPEYPAAWSEDSFFSPAVLEMGWRWDRVQTQCIQDLAVAEWSNPYYQKSFMDRHMADRLRRIR